MTTIRTGAGIAASAALFALSSLSFAAEPPAGSSGRAIGADDKVHCYGINTCQGTSDCKTTANECKGQNVCKGHGFNAVAAGQCLSKGGTIGDLR